MIVNIDKKKTSLPSKKLAPKIFGEKKYAIVPKRFTYIFENLLDKKIEKQKQLIKKIKKDKKCLR